jgi:hypothetical protein
MNSAFVAAGRQLVFFLCIGLFFVKPVLAQSGQTVSGEDSNTSKSELKHYIRAVPRTPADYKAITAEGRFFWFVRSTVGPRSLVAGLFSSGFGTATDNPHEYGTHWVGFGQRYGMRLSGVSASNAVEASLGAAWGEDPRYFHTVHAPFKERVKNIVDLTFRAYGRDGERHPAYARYVAITGTNFLSNTWRVESEDDWQNALLRTAEGFGGRALSDAFSEFFPEVWRKVRRQPDPYAPDEHNP